MGLLRSQEMGYYNLVMPVESGWTILNELGKLNTIQFIDANARESVFNRPFANYIKRCDECERILRYLDHQRETFRLPRFTCEDYEIFLQELSKWINNQARDPQNFLESVEDDLVETERNLKSTLQAYDQLQRDYQVALEEDSALRKASKIMQEQNIPFGSGPSREAQYAINTDTYMGSGGGMSDTPSGSTFSLTNIAGVIPVSESLRLKKMIFRATRGKTLVIVDDETESMPDYKEGEKIEKAVFMIIFRSGLHDVIRKKVLQICNAFGLNTFELADSRHHMQNRLAEVDRFLVEQQNVIDSTRRNQIEDILKRFSSKVCGVSLIEMYSLFVLKEKTIYHTLNKFQTSGSIFHGYCWVPKQREAETRRTLQGLIRQQGEVYGQLQEMSHPPGKPPTFFHLNEFTSVYQEIVDTYGVPSYQEANPAVFTAVTFPFLFGVMYGDVGHAGLLTLFAIWLCLSNRKTMMKGMLAPAYRVRYLLLMMGFFGTYCGFIYNDFLSLPMTLFSTCYPNAEPGEVVFKENDCVYPFGLDWRWYQAKNELSYFNSFKMKLAVILGVIHMTGGVILKGLNSLHFRKSLDFFFEFIPQLIFLVGLFGYMDFLIFYKWTRDWDHRTYGDEPPSIIATMMNVGLKGGSIPDHQPMWGNGGGQTDLQLMLALIAVLCVPLMLLPKPLILNRRNKKFYHGEVDPELQLRILDFQEGLPSPTSLDGGDSAHQGHASSTQSSTGEEHDQETFGQLMIHQLIETIEFVLGAISNTASYLRLWALSLAHAQLAKVFFEKALLVGIEAGNFFMVFCGFTIFACATFGVLMTMDVMECFLHALRLHWVEFQNKFFKADGYLFEPMSFKTSLQTKTVS
mmetsp:Transcript_52719/g.60329  ORF Transcript_52719/g.60329 Transcript_52719/m.60329 type:complete len:856 (+) Transcript_52719:139-2706(+)